MLHGVLWEIESWNPLGWLNEEDTMSSKHLWWGPFTSTFCKHCFSESECLSSASRFYLLEVSLPPWCIISHYAPWEDATGCGACASPSFSFRRLHRLSLCSAMSGVAVLQGHLEMMGYNTFYVLILNIENQKYHF